MKSHGSGLIRNFRFLFVVIIVTALVLVSGRRMQQWTGESGIVIISKVMGLILAAFAVQGILAGLKGCFAL